MLIQGNDVSLRGKLKLNFPYYIDNRYNNYQLPTSLNTMLMTVERPSILQMMSAGGWWHNGSFTAGSAFKDMRSVVNLGTTTIQSNLSVGRPDKTKTW